MANRGRSLILQSMALAAVLAALKTAAGLASNSLALLASALDSAMDFLSSGVNLVSLRLSEEPADEDHNYGHDKIEALAGAGQGLVIGLSGLALLVESIRRVMSNQPVTAGGAALAVMALAMAASAWHGRRLSAAARETGSPILRAEGLHFSMDVLANLGVMLALGLMAAGASPVWDVLISLIISGYVAKEAVALLWTSAQQLVDQSLPEEAHAEIHALIRNHHKAIVGFHDFRTRRAGARIFIDFHIEIAGVDKFADAHEIGETLVEKIKRKIPNADVTVHCDPKGAR